MMNKVQPSGVIWITGLSGSGKTTLAREVLTGLRDRGINSVLVDGDEVRDAIHDKSVGHDRASRLVNARRICRLARMLSNQDLVIVVATISLFHEIHDWNRANFNNYWEVFIKAALDQCRLRDCKNIYGMRGNGVAQDVVGIELMPEFPRYPHMVVENTGDLNEVSAIAEQIIEAFISFSSRSGKEVLAAECLDEQ